jgi:ribonuclease P protein component
MASARAWPPSAAAGLLMPAGLKAASVFPPKLRLHTIKKRRDFLSAAAKGKKFVTGTFIVQMQGRDSAHPASKEARFGFTVTKKMGNAVARNRIKRRLRAAVAQAALTHTLEGHDYVVISRLKALDCPFSDLLRDMQFAFSRIGSMKETKKEG